MSLSPVSICSNALLTLGASPINSFDEAHDHARLCSNLYPTVRDYVLRKHSWNCAIKRVILSPVTEQPPFSFEYQFNLPNDCLRVMSIEPREYILESNRILTNSNTVQLVYVFRNEDVSTWDSSLVSLIELGMSAKLAYAVTKSSSLRDSLTQEFEMRIRQDKAIDGQENPAQELDGYPLLSSRF